MKRKVSFHAMVLIILSIIITFTTLLFFGFIRDGAALIILLLIIPLFYYIGYKNSLLVSISFLLVTVMLNLLVSVSGIMDSVYYEPNVMLEVFDFDFGLPIYLANARLKMTQRMGDLKAVDLRADCDVEPRQIEFNTDSYGFRNDTDYHHQKYFVVGDSFVVGLGNTQKDMLANQLREQYGLDVYSLSHPADITGYSRYVRGFQRLYGGDFKVFLFIYEGNDFPEKYTVKKVQKPLTSLIGRRLRELVYRYRSQITRITRTDLYRLTYVKYLFFKQKDSPVNQTMVENVQGHKIAFAKEYSDVAHRAVYHGNQDIEDALVAIKDRIACIFLIPTKYRVYHHLDREDAPPLPNAQWQFLNDICQRHGIRCINLTADFITEARRLLREENKLIWWADDSHWNKYGIALGARAVSEVLKAQNELPGAGGGGKEVNLPQ